MTTGLQKYNDMYQLERGELKYKLEILKNMRFKADENDNPCNTHIEKFLSFMSGYATALYHTGQLTEKQYDTCREKLIDLAYDYVDVKDGYYDYSKLLKKLQKEKR